MTSINTNASALVALQNLTATNAKLTETQERISTGLKVGSAKDNAAIYAIAQSQRSQVSSLDAVKDSLNRGQSVLDTASAAGQSISDLVTQLKAKALAYSDASNSAQDKAAYNTEYKALYAQIASVSSNASFDGVNLIDDSTGSVSALANASGSAITVAHQPLTTSKAGAGPPVIPATGALNGIPADLSAAGGSTDANGNTVPAGGYFAAGNVATTLAAFDTGLQNVNNALQVLGTGSKQLSNHLTFISNLQDSLTTGIGNLVDADVAKESANLTALQTKQQLGVQSLSIANSAPQTILSLFKG